MRESITAIIFIIFVLTVSIIVANVANFINIDESNGPINNRIMYTKRNNDSAKNSNLLLSAEAAAGSSSKISEKLILNDSPNHLMWFIQISDLHVSMFSEPTRIQTLREFVNETLNVIKPIVVVASGDLTDGRDSRYMLSRQFEDDWKMYNEILTQGNVKENTIWLDIRGNHDTFNMPGDNSYYNFFRTYSIQGKTHKRSYLHELEYNGDKYAFIGIDACLEPGPKFPFNFIGVLTLNETFMVQQLALGALNNGADYIVLFGHFPTSCIVTMKTGSWGFRNLIGGIDKGYVYLCGHLHTLGDLVTKMYTQHTNGLLELELGDWKLKRLYRVAAFDHGLFSFVDIKHGQWPIILVTNPKNAYYHIPKRENPSLQLESTHIRILVFSRSIPITVRVNIVNIGWEDATKITDNLYVLKWDPMKFADGQVYNLEVEVTENNAITTKIIHPFSMEQHHQAFDGMASFVLKNDFSVVFSIFFGVAISLCIAPLIFCRIWFLLVKYNKLTSPRYYYRNKNGCRCIRNYWILSTVDRITIPICFYCIYLTIGPWTYGEISMGGINGYIFAWGFYVNGGYVPQPLTYIYGFFQLLFCQLPLIITYAYIVSKKFFQIHYPQKPSKTTKCQWFWENGFIFCIMSLKVFIVYIFWHAYGTVSFFLGPFLLWSIVLNIVLWQIAKRIPPAALKPAGKVWYYNKSPNGNEVADENPDEK